MFSSSAVQANQDAVLQDCLNIAARAQEWYRKPIVMAGGGRVFTGIDLAQLNIDATNANGSYALTIPTPQSLSIAGTGVEGTPLTVTVLAAPDSITSTTIVP